MSSKPLQCIHRIKSFQAHKECFQRASICEKGCQSFHKTNNEGIILSVDAVQDEVRRVRELFRREIKKYVNHIKAIYTEMISEMEKQRNEYMKQMEKQLITELTKDISLEKGVFQKINNKRHEHIQCHELMTFMEESNLQQKMKKTALPNIYLKYEAPILKLRQVVIKTLEMVKPPKSSSPTQQNISAFMIDPVQPKPNLTKVQNEPSNKTTMVNQQPSKPKQALGANVPWNGGALSQITSLELSRFKMFEQKVKTLENQNKQLRELLSQFEKTKYELQVLGAHRKNLEREIGRLSELKNHKRTPKLGYKTWNILKVSTKKIKKAPKTAIQNGQTSHQSQKQMEATKVGPSMPPNIAQMKPNQPQKMIDESQQKKLATQPKPNQSPIQNRNQSSGNSGTRMNQSQQQNINYIKNNLFQKALNSTIKTPVNKDSSASAISILDVGKSPKKAQPKPAQKAPNPSEDFLSFFRRKKFF